MKKFAVIAMLCTLLPAAVGITAEKEARTIDLPIVMYHSVYTANPCKYIISPKQLESDFTAILNAGYTPVFMSEVINWVDGKGTLPAKPIVITFDDGHYNNLYYGLPIAKKLGVKFMINPVTSFTEHDIKEKCTDSPKYSYLTWAQITEAVNSGLIEIGNHTHKMHAFKARYGIAKLKSESTEQYKAKLKTDVEYAQTMLTNCGAPRPTTFAYPFGKLSPEGRELLIEMGFRAFLTCTERISKIEQDNPSTLYSLGRFNRDGCKTTAWLMKKLTA